MAQAAVGRAGGNTPSDKPSGANVTLVHAIAAKRRVRRKYGGTPYGRPQTRAQPAGAKGAKAQLKPVLQPSAPSHHARPPPHR